jgi:hypothetical protein
MLFPTVLITSVGLIALVFIIIDAVATRRKASKKKIM